MTSRKIIKHLNCSECGMPRDDKNISWMPGFVVIKNKVHLQELPFCRHGCKDSPDDIIQHLCAPLVCKESTS